MPSHKSSTPLLAALTRMPVARDVRARPGLSGDDAGHRAGAALHVHWCLRAASAGRACMMAASRKSYGMPMHPSGERWFRCALGAVSAYRALS
ncbi:hypothetical protein NDU88_005912 [Pleurodeles waltl]|uniref:Uncharacterized protein n=1 Tax=Pleurodeles waltl TaxID=8319 RepID=A0AAV7MBE8_PLEWA|nr:hypothetical protein NDU88_005912 [Pleurodeles waltl]